jgi:hypothetical protein
MLTQAELQAQFNYNSETGIFTRLISNNTKFKIGQEAGGVSNGYKVITIMKKTYPAHRLAWLYMYGKFPNEFIDHINGNPLDNKLCNLREATRSQNGQNKIYAQGKNKYIGAYWHKACKKWFSRITVNGKSIHLGYFKTELEAHEAYIKAKRQHHEFCTI